MAYDVNRSYCQLMLRQCKQDLYRLVGTAKTRELMKSHMDVVGSFGSYFLHWVKDGDLLTEDISTYKQCGNIWEAKAEAISFLIQHIGGDELLEEDMEGF